MTQRSRHTGYDTHPQNRNNSGANANRSPEPLSKKQQERLAQYAAIAVAEGIDLTKINSANYYATLDMLEHEYEKSAIHEVKEFIYNFKANDYSDDLGDYLAAEGLSPSQKKHRALAVLKAIDGAVAERAGVDLVNVIFLTENAMSTSSNPWVTRSAFNTLEKAIDPYQRAFVKQMNSPNMPDQDYVLASIKYSSSLDYEEFLGTVITRHIRKVLPQLNAEGAAKFETFIKDKGYDIYLDLAKDTSSVSHDTPDHKGDKKMTDLTDDQKQKLEALKERFAAANMAMPSEDLSPDNFQSYYDKMNKVITDYEASRASAGDTSKTNPDDAKDSADDKKKGKLNVDTIDPNLPSPKDASELDKPVKWVQDKIDDYRGMEASHKIEGFKPNPEAKDYFEAEIRVGGVVATVRYDSPDNVKVSENANVGVFEAILNEKDNANRTINFAEGMSHDAAMHLKAACLLNGRAMTGTVPDFTAEDMAKLSNELGAERFKELQQIINPQSQNDQPSAAKGIIDSVEELSKAAEQIKKARDKFNEMKDNGLIAVTTDMETMKKAVVAGPNCPEGQEAEVVDKANKLIKSAAEIVKSSKTLSGNLQKGSQADKDNQTLKQERIAQLRDNMNQKLLATHDNMKVKGKDEKMSQARAQRLEQRRQDISVKLGITNDADGKSAALQGKELVDYINKNGITVKNYTDLWKEANKGKDFDANKLEPQQQAVYKAVSQAQTIRFNALMGRGNANTQ